MIEAAFRRALEIRRDKARADYERERAEELAEITRARAEHRSAWEKCWVARHEAERRLHGLTAMWDALAEDRQ